MTPNATLLTLAFFILTTGTYIAGVALAAKRTRTGRYPVGKDIKLLRQPGEGLRERIEKIDGQMNDEIFKGFLVPLCVLFLPLIVLKWLKVGDQILIVLVVILVGYLISLGYRVWTLRKLVIELRDARLGLVGERVVADALEPLKESGYRVFHDIPAQGATKAFNLDHVVVGPTGVFAIETKARRKYEARDGGKDHEVKFDGEALIWPNGRDTDSVKQARDNARWLEEWLFKLLGRRPVVTPILAIPGWYTDETAHGNLRVLSHKRLTHYLSQGSRLDGDAVDLIARQLDSLCRNVEV